MKRVLLIITTLLIAAPAQGALVELTITGSWNASDYDVSSTGPDFPVGDPEGDDDLVFGTAPSNGSTTFQVVVDTAGASFYPAGYLSNGTDALLHDWYGYTNVQLVGTHAFGSATWDNIGIVTALVGVDGTTAALWTDSDIAAANPTRVSFRMFGSGDDLTADLFVGPRVENEILNNFSIAEYFGGEEILSSAYSASARIVPEPSSIALAVFGVTWLAYLGWRRRQAAA